MSLKIYYLTAVIAAILSGITAFIDYKISLGILLATGFSLLNLALLSVTMKAAIRSQSGAGLLMIGNILRYVLLFAGVYAAYRLPQYFSLIGVAIGMTLFIMALFIDALQKRKG